MKEASRTNATREDHKRIAAQAEQIERDLGVIRQALRRPLEAEFARGALTAPQKAAMQVVVRNEGISLKDLSREISLAHSTVSGIIDRLEKQGMVLRKQDQADGRISRIYPAPVVIDFIRKQMPLLTRGPLEEALHFASDPDRRSIVRGLNRLRELLEQAQTG